MTGQCCYCGHEFTDEHALRGYGPGGALTCHPCGTLPENVATTDANMYAMFEAAAAASPQNIIIIGNPDGPEPYVGSVK